MEFRSIRSFIFHIIKIIIIIIIFFFIRFAPLTPPEYLYSPPRIFRSVQCSRLCVKVVKLFFSLFPTTKRLKHSFPSSLTCLYYARSVGNIGRERVKREKKKSPRPLKLRDKSRQQTAVWAAAKICWGETLNERVVATTIDSSSATENQGRQETNESISQKMFCAHNRIRNPAKMSLPSVRLFIYLFFFRSRTALEAHLDIRPSLLDRRIHK